MTPPLDQPQPTEPTPAEQGMTNDEFLDRIGLTEEQLLDAMMTDSGVDPARELAFLRGEGDDPWPASS